jgi:hypothetical protein
MSIHIFQISLLNDNLFNGSTYGTNGPYTSEFPQQPDNINGQLARYYGIMGVWSDVAIGAGLTQAANNQGSYGMPTGSAGTGDQSNPYRPEGGYFLRGVYFADNAVPGAQGGDNGFRCGYYGSFQSGVWGTQFAHDPSNLSVDYETLYGHGTGFTWPQPASIAYQFLDSNNLTADAGLTCTNESSAYTRTQYMPPSTFLLHCANNPAGGAALSTGTVKFFLEHRPTLRAAGWADGNTRIDGSNNTNSGSVNENSNSLNCYDMDPRRGGSTPLENASEYFQISGVRKLNSRGLSLHIAKVFDNTRAAYGYAYEEDGQTVETTEPVNVFSGSYASGDAKQFQWQRGQDFIVTQTTASGTVVTFTCNNSLVAGQQVILNGFSTNGGGAFTKSFNGQVVTVLSSGLSNLQFKANLTTGVWGPVAETQTAVASINPDIRIRQAATFIINEEYYGFVSNTQCSIWSNKSSMIPLVFFDLSDTWTTSLAPRIAGVAVTGVNQNPITSVTVNGSNVVTVVTNNHYVAGQKIYIQNLGNATFLNAQTLTVLTASPTQFTASFTNAAYGPTLETTGSAGGYMVWFLSEDGILAVYDFTTALNGAISLVGFNAPVPSPTPVVTVPPTPPTYCYGAMKASADGSTLYAVYGHNACDPRLSTTSASSPTVGIIPYTIASHTWGSVSNMPHPARHNGRSLNEFIVLRDGRLALMCEEVNYVGTTVTNKLTQAGTPLVYVNALWQVAILDPTGPTWSTAQIDGTEPSLSSPQVAVITNSSGTGPLASTIVTFTVSTMTTPFPVGSIVTLNNYPSVSGTATSTLGGQAYKVLASPAPTTTSFSISAPYFNYTTSNTDSATATQGIQYGSNFTTNGQNIAADFWFSNPNAFLHDVGTNKLLIQSNWTAGGVWVLDITPPTAGISNTNLSMISSQVLWNYGSGAGFANGSGDPFIPGNYFPLPTWTPVSITHARDGATNADRTLFTVHGLISGSSSNQPPVYLAPPSYNWASPTALQLTYNNIYNPGFITGFGQDQWSVQDLSIPLGGSTQTDYWDMPVMLMDNYVHFVRPAGASDTTYAAAFIYGRSAANTIGYLPTYFKWNGSAWVMADNFADAYNHPYTIPNAGVNIPLPYGLQVQFGPSGSDTWVSQALGVTLPSPAQQGTQGHSEFFTFNVAWGNTKFARKSRNTWAMFAGQTFLTTEAHPLTQMTAMQVNMIDTDPALVTFTAPTNVVGGASATLTPPSNASACAGYSTATTWPKLDGSSNPFDATPLVMNIHATTGSTPGQAMFDVTTAVYQPTQFAPTGATGTSATWTSGANTYTTTAGSVQSYPTYAGWYAFAGNHAAFWRSASNADTLAIATGTTPTGNAGNFPTVYGYSFRPYYDGSNNLTGCPHSWTFQGFNGSWVTLDTQSGFTAYQRGLGFKLSSPATGYSAFRINVSATNDNAVITLGMFEVYGTGVPSGTFNFTDITFFNLGNNNGGGQTDNNPLYIMQAGMARGLKWEVSTNNGGSYTQIFPLWRSHMGYVYCFNRQTGITDLRVTCQQGYNLTSGNFSSGALIPATAAFGPLYMFDYGAGISSSRLGSASALDATPPRGSYDTQCLGVAGDAISISLDSGSPSAWQPMYNVSTGVDNNTIGSYGPYSQLYGFWDTTGVPAGSPYPPSTTISGYFKIHPFFGFILFQGAGPSNGASGSGGGQFPTLTGTTLGITYNWGRRV